MSPLPPLHVHHLQASRTELTDRSAGQEKHHPPPPLPPLHPLLSSSSSLAQTFKHPTDDRGGIKSKNRTKRGRKRRHGEVWGWCRQLSVLLESDQTGLAWLLHYILAQSKIEVWPGTALPLGARSFTTHRLYCTQSKPARLQTTVQYMRQQSFSVCACVCVCVFVCKEESEKKRGGGEGGSLHVVICVLCLKWEVIQLLVLHISFSPGCNRPIIV